jgi:UDP-N-acetylglucosamine 2-epimerase (non-hydrolysing)
MELSDQGYAVVTLHRPSNVDDPAALGRIIDALEELQHEMPIIFPVHPRTRKALNGRAAGDMHNLRLVEPLGYLDFMKLVARARIVLTDSGGIQEETTVLGVPCLTLRSNTERPVTVSEGTNILVGSEPEKIAAAWRQALAAPKSGRVPELWDGNAAVRILDILKCGG